MPRPPPGGCRGAGDPPRAPPRHGVTGAASREPEFPRREPGAVRFGGLGAVPAMDLGMDEDPHGVGGARGRRGEGRARGGGHAWNPRSGGHPKRDGADVLIATADESSSSSHPSAKREDATNANVRTAGGVTIVNESRRRLTRRKLRRGRQQARLRRGFEGVEKRRRGEKHRGTRARHTSGSPLVVRESTRPATAAAEMNVQTDGTGPKGLYVGAKKSVSPAGKSSKPIHTAKPGASYFERLFAKNVERMAGKESQRTRCGPSDFSTNTYMRRVCGFMFESNSSR